MKRILCALLVACSLLVGILSFGTVLADAPQSRTPR
jgi:hypothetical protein